jgi:2-keto-4-pentenoate hydratase
MEEDMALTHDQMHHLAHGLMEAMEDGRAVDPLTEQEPGMTEHDAREIALDIIGHRVGDGRRVVGHKVALTSAATQRALGIDSPQFGVILDDMTVRDGGRVKASSLISPRIEPEIAFRLKTGLQGPGVTAEDVIAATDYIFPALEIVDSRIKDWRLKLEDLVADNVAAALVVLGPGRLAPSALDLESEEVVLEIDGVEVGRATGKEVLGNPANAVAWCANALGEHGMGIAAGEFVIPGSMIEAPSVKAGSNVTASFASLGLVSVRFT